MGAAEDRDWLMHGQHERALALLEALGLGSLEHVVSVKLTLTAKDFVTVDVVSHVAGTQFDQLTTELKRYKLVPKDSQA